MYKVLFLFCLLSMPAWAALPPRSSEELVERAELVVEAEVVAVKREKKRVKGGYDYHYTITLDVNDVRKGDFGGGRLDVACRATGKRPDGWAGPQGQNDIPHGGDRGVFYLSHPPSGPPRLLEPNGWEPLP